MCFTFHILSVTAIFTPKKAFFWAFGLKIFNFSLKKTPTCYIPLESKFSAEFKYQNSRVKKATRKDSLCFNPWKNAWERAFCLSLVLCWFKQKSSSICAWFTGKLCWFLKQRIGQLSTKLYQNIPGFDAILCISRWCVLNPR